MAQPQQSMSKAPGLIRLLNPVASRLLRFGMPMGPNTLLTVRGRKSGQPRSFPVSLNEIDGRRWIVGSYGEVNWVRNLRAAGEGVLLIAGRPQPVRAVELSPEEAVGFYRDALLPWFARMPARWRIPTTLLMRLTGGSGILDDPVEAANKYPVFELLPQAD